MFSRFFGVLGAVALLAGCEAPEPGTEAVAVDAAQAARPVSSAPAGSAAAVAEDLAQAFRSGPFLNGNLASDFRVEGDTVLMTFRDPSIMVPSGRRVRPSDRVMLQSRLSPELRVAVCAVPSAQAFIAGGGTVEARVVSRTGQRLFEIPVTFC